MLVAGVVLVVLALLVMLLVLIGGTPSFALSIGGVTWSTNSAGVFVAGMLVMLVLAIGGYLLFLGTRRQARRSLEVRRLRKSVAQSPGSDPELGAGAGASPDESAAEADAGGHIPSAGDTGEAGVDDEVRPRPLGRPSSQGETVTGSDDQPRQR